MSDSVQRFESDRWNADRLLAVRAGIVAARFHARPGGPQFEGSGPLHGWYLVFPRSATEIRLGNEGGVVCTPAHLMCYEPGDCYRRRQISGEGDRCDYLLLGEDALVRLLPELPGSSSVRIGGAPARRLRPLPAPLMARQRALFDWLERSQPQDALGAEEGLLGLAAETLAAWLGLDAAPPVPRSALQSRRQLERVEKAKEWLATAHVEPPSLFELAVALHVSPYHLSREFRRHTGYSLHGFVIEQRLRRAFDRIREDDSLLTTIAADLGFTHQAQFANQFRRAFGCTAGDVRRARRARVELPGTAAKRFFA